MFDFEKLSDKECAKIVTALNFFNTHNFGDKSYIDLEAKLCNNSFDVVLRNYSKK